ncbi:hypothetical protein Droror1_Dr00008663 [Drosera rotundifolia]
MSFDSTHNSKAIQPLDFTPPHPITATTTDTNTNNNNNNQSSPITYTEVKHFKKWFPFLLPCFVVANVVVFAVSMYVNDCPRNSVSCLGRRVLGRFSFQPFKENPLLGPSATTLEKMGALQVDKIVHHHQGWHLITCMWLHAGVFHISANMLSLIIVGIRIEREFGFVKFGALYVVSGLGGSILSALFERSSISVGASGAVFGLLGGMLSELFMNRTIYTNIAGHVLGLVAIVIINLGLGTLPHVDNFAHIGGFLSGFLLGFVLLIRPQHGWVSQKYMPPGFSSDSVKPKYKAYQCILWVVSLVLLILGFTVGLVLLFRGFDGNKHCSWCHYLSCVPTSRWSCDSQPSYCLYDQLGNQVNVTCQSNGRSSTYNLPNVTNSQMQNLCLELCS